MLDGAGRVVLEALRIGTGSAPWLVLGFALAGLLHEFLPATLIARHVGRESVRSVWVAALLGAPLPLCSCGVLPVAAALRRKGAGRAPTLAFLVSTPETGVDSVAVTHGLLGGAMAIVRPLVAVTTALVAGLVSLLIAPAERDSRSHEPGGQGPDHHCCPGAVSERVLPEPFSRAAAGRLWRAVRYGFVTLPDHLAPALVLGLFLTGALSVMLPDDFFATVAPGGGLLPMLSVAVASAALYLCASAATPIAAALVAKGMSPGAALVFLLVGPATNAATIGLVARLLGKRSLVIYLLSISTVSVAAGLLLDALAGDAVRAAAREAFTASHGTAPDALQIGAGLLLGALLVQSWRRGRRRRTTHSFAPRAKRLDLGSSSC